MRWLLILTQPIIKELPLLVVVIEPKSNVLISANKLENIVKSYFHPFVEVLVSLYHF